MCASVQKLGSEDNAVTKQTRTGTLAWGEVSNGVLNKREAAGMVARLGFVQAREAKDRMARALGLLTPSPVELDDLSPAPSALVRDALAYAEETHGAALLRHSWRTFYLGALIARQEGVATDHEILFAASILHDVGLTDTHTVPLSACCFAVSGGLRARDHLRTCGHHHNAEAVGDAIALHLNLHVSRRLHGAEAYLLSRGAVCDLFGAGRHRVDESTLQKLFARFPRDGVIEALQFETADHVDGSRASLLTSLSGKKAPRTPFFDDRAA